MRRVVIEERPGIRLWHLPDHGIVHHELERYPGAQNLEAVLEAGLALVRAGSSKWLSDDRRGGALPKSHHEWAEGVWGPTAVAAGWRHWALVPPTELLGSQNMARVMQIYSALGVNAETFETPEQGLAWLAAQR
ncbi:MAG: hypothetical protein AB7S26_34840 [Sandaracinaceae bacterium]